MGSRDKVGGNLWYPVWVYFTPLVKMLLLESDLRYSNDSGRSGQMKYGSYNNRVSERDSKPVTRSPYVGLGRGKGKFLTQVAILQSGQDRRKSKILF